MRKSIAILALGAILYSCTENETPGKLELNGVISNWNAAGFDDTSVTQLPSKPPEGRSENALILATFSPISHVSENYTTETTLLDISEISCFSEFTSVSDDVLTLGFDNSVSKRQADICGWDSSWGSFPDVEGPNPHTVYTIGQRSLAITLSTPVTTFGFEIQPNFISAQFQVDFYRSGNLIGSVIRYAATSRPPDFVGGASLFAAKTDASFDYILIQSMNPFTSFSLGQFRYKLAEENPFTVDIKPGDCDNPVNVNSNGLISVAVLASLNLDVKDIDLSTLRLNGVAPKKSSILDVGGFYKKEEACDCDPKKLDGVMDLDLKFDSKKIAASLSGISDGKKVILSLSFRTKDGRSWSGEDCITVIKKGKGK